MTWCGYTLCAILYCTPGLCDIPILYTETVWYSYTVHRDCVIFLYCTPRLRDIPILYTGTVWYSYTVHRDCVILIISVQLFSWGIVQKLHSLHRLGTTPSGFTCSQPLHRLGTTPSGFTYPQPLHRLGECLTTSCCYTECYQFSLILLMFTYTLADCNTVSNHCKLCSFLLKIMELTT